MSVAKSIAFFLLACFFEVGGGYLIWIWLKDNKPLYIGILGAFLLICYGIIATFQTQSFGRVYVAYGGFFIIFSLLWAYMIDGFRPDRYDIIGSFILLIGIGVMLYFPRD